MKYFIQIIDQTVKRLKVKVIYLDRIMIDHDYHSELNKTCFWKSITRMLILGVTTSDR